MPLKLYTTLPSFSCKSSQKNTPTLKTPFWYVLRAYHNYNELFGIKIGDFQFKERFYVVS